MKFLAMHITNQKLSFDTFTVGNLQNIFMEHDLYLMFYSFPVAQMVEHGASNAKIMGSIPRESKS